MPQPERIGKNGKSGTLLLARRFGQRLAAIELGRSFQKGRQWPPIASVFLSFTRHNDRWSATRGSRLHNQSTNEPTQA